MLRQNVDQSSEQSPLRLAVLGTEALGGHAPGAPVCGESSELVEVPPKDRTPVLRKIGELLIEFPDLVLFLGRQLLKRVEFFPETLFRLGRHLVERATKVREELLSSKIPQSETVDESDKVRFEAHVLKVPPAVVEVSLSSMVTV